MSCHHFISCRGELPFSYVDLLAGRGNDWNRVLMTIPLKESIRVRYAWAAERLKVWCFKWILRARPADIMLLQIRKLLAENSRMQGTQAAEVFCRRRAENTFVEKPEYRVGP